jgi:HAMP domain-containing protein
LIAVRGEAAEVALGEAQAVLAMVSDEERRGRLADLVAAVQDGELDDDTAQALEELIELGLSTGRIRSVYGPEGEQAALKTFRRLPAGRALSESAAEVSSALDALEGRTLESVKVQSAGPGAYVVSVAVEGLELSVKLDRAGARIHSVGV